ncbi:hypothetical protein ACG33_12115 [Steroidobacter denitrificans]|uniref:Ribosomal protein L11 methyltransferase n=1 Tax=Steroidobacter denitrificans TaxID=465721 RepID=A0A127FDU5_STEDE|nr:50S ribosomal protein L11 methyltransferase [Steroidobacter denitrificans]AMN47829.1 hypothetical protein ACG33_12115 [Steroidobacter denitrificans]
MAFLQLSIDIGAAEPAPFEDALLAAGALSITLQDAADDPVLEPAPGTTPLWPCVRIQALFDEHCDAEALRLIIDIVQQGMRRDPEAARSADGVQMPHIRPRFEILADRAWEREWLKDFQPMRFGRRLWICPGGQRPPSENTATPACLVELDPGLAFGTGTHPTTALCLAWLDGAELHNQRIIDYGCGSGVLAIAALKLGARRAVAIDIDPQALLATRDNAERNAVDDRLSIHLAGTEAMEPADILLANILAEPLQALAATFAQRVVPGGRLVLSGLLHSQASAVARCYAPWFDLQPPVLQIPSCAETDAGPESNPGPDSGPDPWVRLDGTRRRSA